MLNTRSAEDSIRIAESLLYKHGFYTSAVFFPTVAKSEPGIRIAVTALHTEEELKRLHDVFMSLKETGSVAVCG